MAVRGRPRVFDVDGALDAAILVFWERGYEGTTLDDLTEAMGIARPSLYAAFGNKEGVFRRAVARYAEVDMAYVAEALTKPTPREVARHYLHQNVLAITQPDRPPGCLSIQGGLAGSTADQAVVDFLRDSRRAGEQAIAARLQEFVDDGRLPAGEDAAELATFLVATTSGMAVEAVNGASRATLMAVADRALTAFPA